LCVFGISKVLYKWENKVKRLKGETLKIYRALEAFYKSTILLMVRWGFVGAWFHLNPGNLSAPVTLRPEIVTERISLPEISLQEYVEPETLRPPLRTDRAARKRFQIPAPHESAVSLQAYIKRVGGIGPLCGHSEEEDSLEEEEAVSE
jgi:hypothetical protein